MRAREYLPEVVVLYFHIYIFELELMKMGTSIFHKEEIGKDNFRQIFQLYYQPLVHLGMQYLEDEAEVKEVVQDAFLKLWEIRKELPSDSNLKNFLFTLVKNRCLNVLNRRQLLLKHHEKIQNLELYFQVQSLSRINSDYLELEELKEKIETSIGKLPPNCRQVFEMSRFDELKNREIAEKLGISQKTVEAHLTRALKILRTELKDYLPIILAISKLLN